MPSYMLDSRENITTFSDIFPWRRIFYEVRWWTGRGQTRRRWLIQAWICICASRDTDVFSWISLTQLEQFPGLVASSDSDPWTTSGWVVKLRHLCRKLQTTLKWNQMMVEQHPPPSSPHTPRLKQVETLPSQHSIPESTFRLQDFQD